MTAASGISFLAPAKINLSLRVFGRRPDGLHEIRSVMVPVSLYDEVSVSEGPPGVHVEVDAPEVPSDATNSCHKAATLFLSWAGKPAGVRVVLRKRIPSQAGLGGGSSDAAATFKGLMALTGTVPPADTLLGMAAQVGADVPFFTAGGAALVEGFGERITPLRWSVPFFALIVKPPFGLPTGDGYARLSRAVCDPPPPGRTPTFGKWEDIVSAVENDFEGAWSDARPEIGEIKRELLAAGAGAAGLSGSGSAVFGLFRTADDAERAMGRLQGGPGRELYLARDI